MKKTRKKLNLQRSTIRRSDLSKVSAGLSPMTLISVLPRLCPTRSCNCGNTVGFPGDF